MVGISILVGAFPPLSDTRPRYRNGAGVGSFTRRNPLAPDAIVLANLHIPADPALAGEAQSGFTAMRWQTETPSLARGRRRRRVAIAVDLHGAGSAGTDTVTVEHGDGGVVGRHSRVEQRAPERPSRLADRRTALKSNGRHLNPRGGPRS